MEKIVEAANDVLAFLEERGFCAWEKDAILEAAKLAETVKSHTEIDAIATVSSGERFAQSTSK